VGTVQLKKQKVRVAAPRELVYEVVAAAGKTVGGTDEEKLVEFETRWRGRVIKTVEAVELDSLKRIGYRWVQGPIEGVQEEIRFEDLGPETTELVYSGRLQLPQGSIVEALRILLFVRPVFNRLVFEHLEEARRVAERRAQRSRVYPRSADSQVSTRPLDQ
jgi:hypothetical protein